jgi:hypothetical protein
VINLAELTRPKVKLIGEDGNAFSILARCHEAATKAGWTEEQWKEFRKEATSGDYDKLLCTVMDYFDEEYPEDDEDEDEY